MIIIILSFIVAGIFLVAIVDKIKHKDKWGIIFSIPFVLAFLVFHLWPMANTVLYAFCDLKHTAVIDNPQLMVSKGLPWYKNVADLFKTSSFWSA